MFLQSDLFFSYKNVLRFLLIHKCGYFENTYQLPIVKHLYVYFSLDDIVDFDDVTSFNYFYLFKFFFGRKAFFSRVRSIFHLGVTYYYFSVFSFFFDCYSYFILGFFVNDLLVFSNTLHLTSSVPSLSTGIFSFKFFDLNLFLEKKTNVGLYNLRNSLNLRFKFSCNDLNSCFFFFDFFKLSNIYDNSFS